MAHPGRASDGLYVFSALVLVTGLGRLLIARHDERRGTGAWARTTGKPRGALWFESRFAPALLLTLGLVTLGIAIGLRLSGS